MQSRRYDNLDGLRAFGAVGIVLMHILANGSYGLGGFVFEKLIPSFADFVFLFMVVSGFSLCCGYFEKLTTGKISLGRFYARRFSKVWPFFAVLCLLEVAVSPGWGTVYELLANLTLCFGLIPDANITVIGVGWFLGLVFVFYFLFPFICCLLENKKRAWLGFGVSLLLSYVSSVYFGADRSSISVSGVFFMAGCLLYLYREPLSQVATKLWWALLIYIGGLLAVYYLVFDGMIVRLALSSFLLIYALRIPKHKNTVLSNPVTKWVSAISMEIYLSHMVIVSGLKRLNLIHPTGRPVLDFALTAVMTLGGTVVFCLVVNKLLAFVMRKWKNKAAVQGR